MIRKIAAVAVLLALGGCNQTTSTDSSMSSASSTSMTTSSLAGTWTGALDDGSAIRVRIPESGTPTYSFGGSSVPVRSSKPSGSGLVLVVGQGGGTVTLTPAGDNLNYNYRFRGDSAATTLTRS